MTTSKISFLLFIFLFSSLNKYELQPTKSVEIPKNYTETVNGVSFNMIYVEGGKFKMGDKVHRPIHKVELDDYYVGETEVTQELYAAVMETNPSFFKECPTCPVERVNWFSANAFIEKLNELTGSAYRLPTEAEWEYAARGGKKSRNYQYSGADNRTELLAAAWVSVNADLRTHPVATKTPNELGIYDMSGNVDEWCSDWFKINYGLFSTKKNPQGPKSVKEPYKVLRGSGFDGSFIRYSKVSHRKGSGPQYADFSTGFRIVKTK